MTPGKELEIAETKLYVFQRDGMKCQFPGCEKRFPELQAAHIIPNSKGDSKRSQKLIQKFWREIAGQTIAITQAEKILNSPLNFRSACAAHNQYFAQATNEIKQKKVVEMYYRRNGFFNKN